MDTHAVRMASVAFGGQNPTVPEQPALATWQHSVGLSAWQAEDVHVET